MSYKQDIGKAGMRGDAGWRRAAGSVCGVRTTAGSYNLPGIAFPACLTVAWGPQQRCGITGDGGVRDAGRAGGP